MPLSHPDANALPVCPGACKVGHPGLGLRRGSGRRPGPAGTSNLAFVGWASAIFLAESVAMLLICRHVTGGRVVYVVDDAAIHLSVARTLLQHATWGVRAGTYESVSSSPLWGVVLAGAMWITRTTNILPWVLNVLGGLWLLWAVGSRQPVLRPSRRAPLSVVATVGLVTVVLFMPSLTMVGMEHLLHAAMVVQLTAWIHDRSQGRATRMPTWAPYLLTALAVLTRFETLWVVAGLGLGYLIDGWAASGVGSGGCDESNGRVGLRLVLASRSRLVVGLGLSAAAPVAMYAVFNRAMGQGLLPNSVLAKTASSNAQRLKITPQLIMNHLTADPLVAVLLLASIAYLAVAVPRGRHHAVVPAVTVIVSIIAHSTFAQYGYFERYQAYLIALGIYFALSAASEALPDRSTAVAVLAIAALLVTPVKWSLLVQTPAGADNTYAQRYEGALFVQRYYDGRSIATGELGYLSLFHRGPLFDVLGLSDYDALQHRRQRTDSQAFYARRARQAGVQIALVYSCAPGNRTPSTWFLVAEWRLDGSPVSTLSEPYQFWATSPANALALRAQLTGNAPRLPPHIIQDLNRSLDAQISAGAGGNPDANCPTDRL